MLQNAQHADGEEHSREPPLNCDFPPDGHTGATVLAFPVQFGRQFFCILFNNYLFFCGGPRFTIPDALLARLRSAFQAERNVYSEGLRTVTGCEQLHSPRLEGRASVARSFSSVPCCFQLKKTLHVIIAA